MGRNARVGVVCLMALAIGLARLIEVELDPGAPPPLVVATPPSIEESPAAAAPAATPPVVVHLTAPVPPADPPAAPGSLDDEWPRGRTYVVKSGETLGTISKKVFGTTKHWRKIQDANRPAIPDPARMRPGLRLRLPDVR